MPDSESFSAGGRTIRACPRCGSSTAHPFADTGGVCLRCAGERAFGLGSGVPFEDLADAAPDAPGHIGPYEIIEELGRGGMGRVFAARQSGLGRIVALKVLPTGGGAAAELELRFLREAQTVARLRHPHIIAIHDSGRTANHVYFSMDYIEGGDLARRLREQPFTPRAAAALVEKIAGALAYAHAEGVLHRDLKPSNVLLDGDEPCLADFGLAAQLEAGGDLTTASGVLGTPHYLAPEALHGGSAALSVASDLYALGVVLYEMLTGRTPFAGVSPAELAALIDRTEPPAPRLLAPAVPLDLETICLKCLERDPGRRYTGAALLAEDLRRFLAGEPILARPPGRLDMLLKYSRRHRAVFAAVGAATLTLLAATAVSTWLAVRAIRAEKRAATEAAISRAESEFLQNDLLAQASPEEQPDRDLKLRTVLDRAAKKIDGRFPDQPLVEAALRVTLAATYESLGEYDLEQPQLERALALRRQAFGPRDPRTLKVMSALTLDLQHRAKYREAETLGAETLKLQKEVLGPEHADTLESANTLALVYQYAGKYPAALALFEDTLARRQHVLGSQHPDTLETISCLAVVLRIQGQLARAESLERSVVAVRQRTPGPEHPATLRAMNELASIFYVEGKFAEAEAAFLHSLDTTRRVMGVESPDTLTLMNNLALTLQAEGKLAQAEAMFTEVVAVSRRIRGPEHPGTLNSMLNLALTLQSQEDYAGAEKLYLETWTLMKRVLGAEHNTTLSAQVSFALTYGLEGKFTEAEAMIAPALSSSRRSLGPEHPTTIAAMNGQAMIDQEEGRLDEAAALQQQTLDLRKRVLGPEHPTTAISIYNLALIYQSQGRIAEAANLHRQALEIRQRKLGPTNLNTLQSLDAVGRVLIAQEKFEEAAALLRPAWDTRRQLAPDHWRAFNTQSLLGAALSGQKRFSEAEPLLLAAQAGLTARAAKIGPLYRGAVPEATKRLADLYTAWGKPGEAQRWQSQVPDALSAP
jgi:tetratricopeptide (TPR) repeat protein